MISNHSYIPVLENNIWLATNDQSKEKLTSWLKSSVTKVQNAATQQNSSEPLPQDLPEVWQLCECLDKALLHGLKQLQYGYWSFVREFTHPNCRLQLESLTHVHSGLGRGRAWLCQALNESSLESFFGSFTKNPSILGRYYTKAALLRDIQRMQVINTLMAGLEFVIFNMPVDTAYLDGRGFSYFQSAFDQDSETDTLSASSSGMESKSPSATPVSMQSLADEETEDVESAEEVCDDDPSPHDHHFNHKNNSGKREHVTHLIGLDTDLSDHENSSVEVEVTHTKILRRRKKMSIDTLNGCESSDNGNIPESSLEIESACDKDCDKPSDVEAFNPEHFTELNRTAITTESPMEVSTTQDTVEDPSEVNYLPEYVENLENYCVVDFTLLGERGAPEGQEDPATNLTSDRDITNESADILASSLEEISIYDSLTLKGSPKNRFIEELSLHSGHESSHFTSQDSFGSKTSSVFSQEELVETPPEDNAHRDGSLRVDNNMILYLSLEVFQHENELLYKVFLASVKRWNKQLEPVFIVLSDQRLYVLSEVNESQGRFRMRFSSSFEDIDKIMVSLSYHSFVIHGHPETQTFKIYTGSDLTTRSILSNLEVVIRRNGKLVLPSVITFPERQLQYLLKLVSKEVLKKEENVELQHFACVQWENYMGLSPASTPAGPIKEGFLMYKGKFTGSTSWSPAYFHLKAGVLYCFKDQSSATPYFYFQLHYPHFHGCRRVHSNSHRPHSFELRLQGHERLLLAAPNDYEASSWQQAIMQMVSLFGHLTDIESGEAVSCDLVIAEHRFFIIDELREDQKNALQASAALADLSAICIDQECPTCFVLEFESGEANSCGGEWIIIFSDAEEKEKALDTISNLWEHLFQIPVNVTTIKDLSIWSRCREHYQQQKSTRDHLVSLFSTS